MSFMITTRTIAPGVTLHALKSEKFKSACFSLNFLHPHRRETAVLDALVPSVLLRGSEQYPHIRSISSRLDELYGASVGTLVRCKGEVKFTGFYADFIEDEFVPEGEAVFAPVVEFLEEILYHPLLEGDCFCADFVEGEKQNLINAIEAGLNNKRSYAVKQMLDRMCQGSAFAVPRLGYAEDVPGVSPEQLWEHYQKLLRSDRVEIFYSGRLEADTVAAAFAPLFREGRDYRPQSLTTPIYCPVEELRSFTETLDVNQGKLVLGLGTGITADCADYPALLLFQAVFSSGTTSKLFQNVREKRSLCYYVSASFDKYKGIMLISSGIAFDKFEAAKAAILEELEACRRGEISPAELETAKRQCLSSMQGIQDSPPQLDDFYCGKAILPCLTPEELIRAIGSLEKEAVVQVARKLQLDSIYFLKGEEA